METIVIRTKPTAGNPSGAVVINKSDYDQDPEKYERFDAPEKKPELTAEEIAAAKQREEDEGKKEATDEGVGKDDKTDDAAVKDAAGKAGKAGKKKH